MAHFAIRNGIAARFGGDEFACILITDEDPELSSDEVRERFESALKTKSEFAGRPYSVNASVGGCCCRITADMKLEELVKKADEKMYADKAQRKKGR